MNNERLNQILKDLNDYRSRFSALYSLYNSSLLVAEEDRAELSSYYEQMIDLKNELSLITTALSQVKKAERANELSRQRSKIKRLDAEIKQTSTSFESSCKKYRIALKECGSLKTEYKHSVSELCNEFKSLVSENTEEIIIKGYKQQVKIIKSILERIEQLICNYNVQKNKVEEDNTRFTALYETANSLLKLLEA